MGWTRCPVSHSGHGWGRMGQLKAHPGSQRGTGMEPGPVPVLWTGWRIFTLMMCSVVSPHGGQTGFTHQTPGASRCSQVHLHFCASRPNSLQKVLLRCLTAPGAKLSAFPRACISPPDLPWDHGTVSPSPAAALGQARCMAAGARCFRHGVCRGGAAPPRPPRAEGNAGRKLLLTELRALPDWG